MMKQKRRTVLLLVSIIGYSVIIAFLVIFASQKYGVHLEEGDVVSIDDTLNKEQEKWLIDHRNQSFSVAIDPNYKLFYFDYLGEKDGYLVDFADYFKRRYGIELAIINETNSEKITQLTESGKYHVSLFNAALSNLPETGSLFSDVYYIYTFSNKEVNTLYELNRFKVGIANDFRLTKYIQSVNFDLSNLVKYQDTNEMYEDLMKGEIKYIISAKYLVDKRINRFPLNENIKFDYRIQSNKDNKMLATILYKIGLSLLQKENPKSVITNYQNKFLEEFIRTNYPSFFVEYEDAIVNYATLNLDKTFVTKENDFSYKYNEKLLERIETVLNIHFNYVDTSNQSDKVTLDSLYIGQIDLLSYVEKQSQFIGKGQFSSKIYQDDYLIIAPKNESQIIGNLNDIEGRRIGFIKSNELENYLNENLLLADQVIYTDPKKCLNDLINKRLDYAILSKDVLQSLNTEVVSNQYSVQSKLTLKNNRYFLFNLKQQELLDVIDSILPFIVPDLTLSKTTSPNNSQWVTLYIIFTLIILFVLVIFAFFVFYRYRNQEKTIKETEAKLYQINHSFESTLSNILEILENTYTGTNLKTDFHNLRVTYYSEFISLKLGLKESMISDIIKFAPLHDIGKILIRSDEVFEEDSTDTFGSSNSRAHVFKGYELMKKLGFGLVAENIVLYHHEKWNGQGYLSGLSENDIPIEARIVALANMYDHLRTGSEHLPLCDHVGAIDYIEAQSGEWIDPKLVSLFKSNHLRFKSIYDISLMISEKMNFQ